MQLCYRGNSYYRQTNQINTVNSGMSAKYRGNSYIIYHIKKSLDRQPNLYQYRGVTYLKEIIYA
ncbi:MAG: DUF4278 domain-containing protein [Pleurocapsa sp. MO_192.B19]|nr:DUF4278 domain-containing protein [Pleurocapsa sp. MO_192.B19]